MVLFGFGKKASLPKVEEALPGRAKAIPTSEKHYVNGHNLKAPYPDGMELAMFGMGCFWGAERKFWQIPGVYVSAVGYAAGYTPNPTYQEVCSGLTGHNEVVLVVYDPKIVSYSQLLKVFWESHNPTQGMRQGNDAGTQYRSGIYYYSASQKELAENSKSAYQEAIKSQGHGNISTEISEAPEYDFAEDYHQPSLAKIPNGYCGLGGINVSCPLPLEIKGL